MRKALFLLLLVFCLIPMVSQAGGGLGLKGGFLDGDEMEDKINMLGADIRIGMIPLLELILSGEYAWDSQEFESEEYKLHNIAATGSLVVPVKLSFITPYAGGGAGAHMYIQTGGDETETDTKFGYHFVGGVILGVPSLPLKLFGEYRHYWVKMGEEANFSEEETIKYHTLAGGLILGF
jgi:opacity protein-like surface antigen